MVVGQEAVEGAELPFPLSGPSDRYGLKYDPVWQMGGAQLEPVCYTYGQPLTSPINIGGGQMASGSCCGKLLIKIMAMLRIAKSDS